jgi:hypothetical protein
MFVYLRMPVYELTKEQVDACILSIKEIMSTNSSASVRSVISPIRQQSAIWPQMVEQVSAKMIESGEFLRTEKGDDYFIYKNQNYKKPNFWKKYPFIEKFILIFIGAMFALIANLYTSNKAKQDQLLKEAQQDSLIKDVSDSVKTIQRHLIH